MTPDEPSTGLVVGTLLLALLAAWLWPITRYLITIAHEGAHAFTASATGGKVISITVQANSDGTTEADGGNGFLVLLAGYAGPSMFGVVGAMLLAHGVRPDAVLWTAIVLLAATLFQTRNVFGLLATAVAGTALFMVARNASPGAREVCAYTLVWFLLLGGIRGIAQHGRNAADADLLRQRLKLPRGFWAFVWWLATLAGLVYGGGLLLGAIDLPGA